MKKILLSAALFAVSFTTLAQVGIGTETPEGILDVVSTDSGLVVPRVANIAAVTTPVNGTIVYDIASNCIRTYENGVWANCLGAGVTTITVTNDCDASGVVTGENPRVGAALLTASFSVTLTNSSFAKATAVFSAGDLVLSGASSSNITVGTPYVGDGPSTLMTLDGGKSQKITYPLTGSPSALGTLTATWTKLNLSCTKTIPIVKGDAAFTLPPIDPILSIGDTNADMQGVIDNATNKITIDIPYTSGAGTYDAYTSTAVVATGESADTNNITISYPAGTFSGTGSITVTVVVDGDGTFNVKKQLFNVLETIGTFDFQVNEISKGNIVLQASGGAPTVKVNASGGTTLTFLAHNLGADTSLDANTPLQAIHGNYYQWGRSIVAANANTPSAAISGWNTSTAPNGAWSDSSKTAEDPCPDGYKVPSASQWNLVIANNTYTTIGTFTNSSTNFSSAGVFGSGATQLTLPTAGSRGGTNGALLSRGLAGLYWTSTMYTTGTARYTNINNSNSFSNDYTPRTQGFSVRCVKEN